MGHPAQCPWQAFLLLPLLRLTACRSGAHQPLFIKLVLTQLEHCPTQKTKEEKQTELLLSSFVLVPGTGIEPVRPQWPRDFKSLVSTNSTIWATFSGYKGTPFARMPKGNGARKHNTCLKFPARTKGSDIFTFQNTRTLHREFQPETRAKTTIKHKKIEIMQNRAQKCFFVRHN